MKAPVSETITSSKIGLLPSLWVTPTRDCRERDGDKEKQKTRKGEKGKRVREKGKREKGRKEERERKEE